MTPVPLRLAILLLPLLPAAVADPAVAQSTVSPSGDWNGNYGFSTSSDRNLRLLQSDLIRKSEEGYYEGIGRQTYNVFNSTSNSSVTHIGEQTTTTTIGAVNNATNNIDISNSTNIDVSTDNSASNTGCQNGSILIDSRPPTGGETNCN